MSQPFEATEVVPPVVAEGWRLSVTDSRVWGIAFELSTPRDVIGRGALTRCVAGRLRDAYPVGAHDLELTLELAESLSEGLAAVARGALAADPKCRRVVVAVPVDDAAARADADSAGLRDAVAIDLRDDGGTQTFQLMVLEPDWVTRVDMHLDKVPGT